MVWLRERLIAQWEMRTPREQILLLSAGAMLVLACWYFLVHVPLTDARENTVHKIERVERAQIALARLPDTTTLEASLSASVPLQQRVTRSAQISGIPIQRIEARDGRVELTIEEVSYARLVRWLSDAHSEYAMGVTALQVSRRPMPGHVSANLTLEAK